MAPDTAATVPVHTTPERYDKGRLSGAKPRGPKPGPDAPMPDRRPPVWEAVLVRQAQPPSGRQYRSPPLVVPSGATSTVA